MTTDFSDLRLMKTKQKQTTKRKLARHVEAFYYGTRQRHSAERIDQRTKNETSDSEQNEKNITTIRRQQQCTGSTAIVSQRDDEAVTNLKEDRDRSRPGVFMERRNGGTSLAPPRPPKSLPRVHRPRAPDPSSAAPSATIVTSPAPTPNSPAMTDRTMTMMNNGAVGNGGHLQPLPATTAAPTPPPQLSPKPRHLIGGSSSSVLSSTSLSGGNSNNLASNISSNSNNNMNININNNNNNNNTIFINNNPHNHNTSRAASGGGSNFNNASLISSNGISSRSNSSSSSSTSTSNSSSASSRGNCNLNNNNSSSSSGNSRSGSSQHHQPHHHHHHNHPHQQSNRSIGSNSSTLSSVSSSSSTVALLRPQIAPLVPLHSRSSTPPPPPLPPHQRPTSPAGSTFARRRLSPPPLQHPHHLTSIPLGSAGPTTVTSASGALPVLLLPIDQPIAGGVATSPASNPTTPVTLAAPRPENERLANEYVDTPFGRGNGPATTGANIPSTGGGPMAGGLQQTGPGQQHRNLSQLAGEPELPVITGQPRPALDRSRSPAITLAGSHSDVIRVVKSTEGRHGVVTTTTTAATAMASEAGHALPDANTIARGSSIITKQPTKKKDGSDRHELLELELQHHHHHHHHRHHHGHATGVATVGGAGPGGLGAAGTGGSDGLMGIGSITCPRCRRCRCEECLKPRPLPSHWLCDKSCLCSAETIIDYASCLCCVKALYYHCSKEHEFEREVIGPDGATETETVSCADDPCSCVPHKRTTRWGCLGALSLALPCLWCYWPMRGCVAICARCYAKHSRHGCRCTQHPAAPSAGFPPGGGTGAGILNGAMFHGGSGGVGGNGGANAAGVRGRESRAGKSDPAEADSPLHHLHHHLRHHLHQHRSGAAADLTTPEKRLLDASTDAY
uniref:Protein sprouty n=1 Tax=Anopheles dirus TaxID=7168 RepID=A0A182NNH8_9DIPT